MFLAFGVTFEIPVVVMVLARAGIVTHRAAEEARPYVIVGAFVVAAVVTPPDVLSQLLLAIPMCLLYELGLFLARFIVKPAGESDWRAPVGDRDGARARSSAEADSKEQK